MRSLAGVLAALGLAPGGASFGALGGPIPVLNLEFGVTPFAAAFCALIAGLDVAVALWSLRRGRAVDGVLLAAFSAAMLLVLCAQSVAAFFFAWESMALVSAFLVAAHSELRGVRRATFLYLVVSQTGAACILVLLLILALHAGDPSFAAIARRCTHAPRRFPHRRLRARARRLRLEGRLHAAALLAAARASGRAAGRLGAALGRDAQGRPLRARARRHSSSRRRLRRGGASRCSRSAR